MDSETRDGPPRALLIAAIVVAVGAVIGILVFAALRQSPARRTACRDRSVPAPQGRKRRLPHAGRRAAGATRRLPSRTRGRTRTPGRGGVALARTARRSSCAAGWTGPPSSSSAPAPGRRRRVVVSGGRSRGGRRSRRRRRRSTWFAVDRPVYVALTLPRLWADADPGDLRAIAKSCPPRPLTRRRCVSADPCRASAPFPPWWPTASDSPLRWPPTSSDTSRSW